LAQEITVGVAQNELGRWSVLTHLCSSHFFFFIKEWLQKQQTSFPHALAQDVHNVELQIVGEIDQGAP
jgi:hypothetical protein